MGKKPWTWFCSLFGDNALTAFQIVSYHLYLWSFTPLLPCMAGLETETCSTRPSFLCSFVQEAQTPRREESKDIATRHNEASTQKLEPSGLTLHLLGDGHTSVKQQYIYIYESSWIFSMSCVIWKQSPFVTSTSGWGGGGFPPKLQNN